MSKKTKPGQLKKLLKAWSGATAEERAAFLDFASAEARASSRLADNRNEGASLAAGAMPPSESADGKTGHMLIANGRYLLPDTIARIETIMRQRRLSPGAIMSEIGFSARDTSLTRALAMKAALRLSVIAALANWLAEQEAAE